MSRSINAQPALIDNRVAVEIFGDVMAGCPDQLDAALMGFDRA